MTLIRKSNLKCKCITAQNNLIMLVIYENRANLRYLIIFNRVTTIFLVSLMDNRNVIQVALVK